MSNYAITNTSEFYEFHRTCKDVSKAILRAYRGKPRKTDAVLLDELVEIIRGTADWAKTVKPVRQAELGTLAPAARSWVSDARWSVGGGIPKPNLNQVVQPFNSLIRSHQTLGHGL